MSQWKRKRPGEESRLSVGKTIEALIQGRVRDNTFTEQDDAVTLLMGLNSNLDMANVLRFLCKHRDANAVDLEIAKYRAAREGEADESTVLVDETGIPKQQTKYEHNNDHYYAHLLAARVFYEGVKQGLRSSNITFGEWTMAGCPSPIPDWIADEKDQLTGHHIPRSANDMDWNKWVMEVRRDKAEENRAKGAMEPRGKRKRASQSSPSDNKSTTEASGSQSFSKQTDDKEERLAKVVNLVKDDASHPHLHDIYSNNATLSLKAESDAYMELLPHKFKSEYEVFEITGPKIFNNKKRFAVPLKDFGAFVDDMESEKMAKDASARGYELDEDFTPNARRKRRRNSDGVFQLRDTTGQPEWKGNKHLSEISDDCSESLSSATRDIIPPLPIPTPLPQVQDILEVEQLDAMEANAHKDKATVRAKLKEMLEAYKSEEPPQKKRKRSRRK